MQPVRLDGLRWAVGILTGLIGAMMLVTPHQFASPVYAALQPQLVLWGLGFLLVGTALLAVQVLGPPRWFEVASHLFAGIALLVLAFGLAAIGGWTGTAAFGVLGVGTAIAPLLPWAPVRHPTGARTDLVVLLVGLANALTGLTILGVPQQFGAPIYDVIRAWLPWFGLAFLLSGLALVALQLLPAAPRPASRAAQLLAGATLLAFFFASAVPLRAWIGMAYYGGVGTMLVLQPWLGSRLRVARGSLQARLGLGLALCASLPLVLLATLINDVDLGRSAAGGEAASAARDVTFGFLLLFLALAAIIGALLARGLAAPLRALATASRRLAAGDASAWLPESGPTEIEQLAAAFGDMREQLAARTAERELLLRQTQRAAEDLRQANERLQAQSEQLQAQARELNLRNAELTEARQEALQRADEAESLFAVAMQAHHALQESEARYHSLFTAMAEGFALLRLIRDEQGRPVDYEILDVNPANERITGLPRERTVGKRGSEVAPDPEDYWLQAYATVATTGEPLRVVNYSHHFDRWFELYLYRPGTDLVATIFTDVTERRRVEGEREQLLEKVRVANQQLIATALREQEAAEEAQRRAAEQEAIVTCIADGVVIQDTNGQILLMNPAAERLLGYTASEASLPIERRATLLCLETIDGRPIALKESPAGRALAGETVLGMPLVMHSADGRAFWVSVSAAPLRSENGQLLGAAITFTDLSKLHELEAQREQFVHMISHDLRNPLTVVKGYASLLQRQLLAKGLTPEAGQAGILLESSRLMDSMISDLADMARLEAGRMELRREPTDLHEALIAMCQRVGTREDATRIRVECPQPLAPVLMDRRRMERAVANLVANALKYSPPDSPVVVHVLSGNGEAVVSVADQGMGLTPSEQAQVFERYYRARTGTHTEGLGLGLYITRMLVEAHGGRVSVESAPGQGSTFSFSLPLVETSAQPADRELLASEPA